MAQVLLLPNFQKQLQKIIRKTHSKSFQQEVRQALHEFLVCSSEQRQRFSIGHHQYKIRIGSKSQHLGKSGGFRALILLAIPDKELFIPYALYSKNEYDELPLHLKNILLYRIKTELRDWTMNH